MCCWNPPLHDGDFLDDVTTAQRHRIDVDAGITAVELDTQDQYFVGLGGLPNADGVMEYDAAIMDGKTMKYGAVMAVR